MRQVDNDALASLDGAFAPLYADFGRPSIAPERLIGASLIQILFSVRSERQLMEQMQYNLMFCWFVGLGIDYPVWGGGCLTGHGREHLDVLFSQSPRQCRRLPGRNVVKTRFSK